VLAKYAAERIISTDGHNSPINVSLFAIPPALDHGERRHRGISRTVLAGVPFMPAMRQFYSPFQGWRLLG
jgi:hypothetical protein